MNTRAYYSQRNSKKTGKNRLDITMLKDLLGAIYIQFQDKNYFVEAFGYYCVDAGDIFGTLGKNPELFLFKRTRNNKLWPINFYKKELLEEDVFDLVEFLHDIISVPLEDDDAYHHTYSDCGWHYKNFDKGTAQKEFRDEVNFILRDYRDGYCLTGNGSIKAIKEMKSNVDLLDDDDIPTYLEINSSMTNSSFDRRFQFGLPVKNDDKPIGLVEHSDQGQKFKYEEGPSTGVLRGEIYPNFCMYDFARWIDPSIRLSSYLTPIFRLEYQSVKFNHTSWTVAYNLCDTDSEKRFLKGYLIKFVVPYKDSIDKNPTNKSSIQKLQDKVPALIPQVWINWNSHSKKLLNRMGYADTNLPYRLDFVAFWQNRNFVILLDDIGHYAKKPNTIWYADEEKYSARLREDRLLRTQGWNVFRISNYETKDPDRLNQALDELRMFIGFDEPPILEEDNDELPF
jgi:hypothetical protein